MRKYQHTELLNILQTVSQAQTARLYAHCQDGALAICDFIDDIEGAGTKTVELLEQYCEILFKVNNGELSEKTLHKHFVKIEKSIKHDINISVEIAFLTYKASMSDSLETIYLAAKADPNCNAFWIPVPYFEKDASGASHKSHYEGRGFYDDSFEITDWQLYDMEKRRPDVIFTFAPYDDWNFVTTIHPDFHCARLRSLTPLLIYVPYFVSTDGVAEHFCTLPGVIFANHVILQSKTIRDIYVRVFKEQHGNEFGKPEDKFVALGSPKFDKCYASVRTDYELPQTWSTLIGDKKVILYNTSLSAILRDNEKYLDKIRFVLKTFKERDDVILWWRPHPLNEATCQSMRPQLLAEYNQIVSQYTNEGWGIYDDTPHLHRAIACSDAYYGDRSSVVALYSVTGKPIMMCNVNTTSNEMPLMLSFMYKSKDTVWASFANINALFKFNEETWELEFVSNYPAGYIFERDIVSMYCTPVEHNGILYFPPLNTSEIALYSITENAFSKIPLNQISEKSIGFYFGGTILHEDHIYFTPVCYPAIVKLNVHTNELTYYTDWLEPLSALCSEEPQLFFEFSVVVDNVIYMPSLITNAVVAFDMESCKSTVYRVGEKGFSYRSICYDGENFWVSPRLDTPTVKWHPQKGVLNVFNQMASDSKAPFLKIFYKLGHVWLIPHSTNQAYKIDVTTDVVSTADEFNLQTVSSEFIEDTLYLSSFVGSLTSYCFENSESKQRDFTLSADLATKIKSSILYDSHARFKTLESTDKIYSSCYYESTHILSHISLTNFIDYIVTETDSTEELKKRNQRKSINSFINANNNGTTGQAILKFIKNTLIGKEH